MTYQAYIDDSSSENGIFVLAGHIASKKSWKNFSNEWKELLPLGTLDKAGVYHFKMTEMAISSERMERALAFYRVIEKYVSLSITCTFNVQDLERAKERIYVPNLYIDWGFLNNRYLFAFRALMDMFHTHKARFEKVIPLEQKVDFIFDEQVEKKEVLLFWDDYIKQRPPEIQKYYGITPQFLDDKICPPLQAADFWAWWTRKWTERGTSEKMEFADFGIGKGLRRDHPKLHFSFTEDDIVKDIIQSLRGMLGPERIIYDMKYHKSLIA
jgi:hypothetical protein